MRKINVWFDKALKFSSEGFNPVFRENGDFWRLHLDYGVAGKPRELGVYSHDQDAPEVTDNGSEIIMTYPRLKAEDGSIHEIKLTLSAKTVDNTVVFEADMENGSEVRLNEIQYPFFDFTSLNAPLEEDVLYLPNGLGRRIANPHRRRI